MTNEEAIAELDGLDSTAPSHWHMPDDVWDADDAAALRHLIAEARKVERVRQSLVWLVYLSHGIGKAGVDPESGEWDEAWASAEAALSAPDAETEVKL